MDLSLLIVNFHYVRAVTPHRGVYGITPEAFEVQLDMIHGGGFKYVSLEDVNAAIANVDTSTLPKKSCLITFDDGLRESYEVGQNILDKKGIPGAYYVCSSMVDCDKVLDVHKFHYIQSQLSDVDILGNIPDKFIKRLESISSETISNQYSWDEMVMAKIKYLINFLLTPSEREVVVGDLFNVCISSEVDFAKKLYLTQEQIKEIANRNSLGTHGCSHTPMSLFSKAELYDEISRSCNILQELTNQSINSISYPYGGESAVSQSVFESARALGMTSGMTMMRGINSSDDLLYKPMQLKRFDTNDVFGGKSEALYKELFS